MAILNSQLIKIGITVGDINGIGLEIILKTLHDERVLELCTPIIYGSGKVVAYHKNIVALDDLKFETIQSAEHAKPGVINVVNCWTEEVSITLGQVTQEGGMYAGIALGRAVDDAKAGLIHALVTAPIHKKSMQLASFPHPGHTEFLAAQTGVAEHLMLMVSDEMRIGLATGHVPLNKISEGIKRERLLKKLEVMYSSLRRDFGIDRPRIAVLGLNPHAGDEGALGNEEQQHIAPAVNACRKNGMLVFGPYAADGFFGAGTFSKFDAILAMYHDQGLAPFKALSFHGGVNYTAGLPFVRTSPDHGTGFDIAGQNIANPDSFRAALFLALDVTRQRAKYADMNANPLRPQDLDEDISKELAEMGNDGVIRT